MDIRINFTKKTKYGEYNDAFYFPMGEVPSETELEALKQERVDNWIYTIEHPPTPIEPTVAELLETKQNLETQLGEVTAKIALTEVKTITPLKVIK